MFWSKNASEGQHDRIKAPGRPWGENLLNRSLATLWRPTSWDAVEDDELVYLLPGLSRWQPAGDDKPEGPAGYLARALTEQARSIARTQPGYSASRSLGELRPYLTSLTPKELFELEGEMIQLCAKGTSAPSDSGAEGNRKQILWLALLDRLLNDVRGEGTCRQQSSLPTIHGPLSLADAIYMSAAARLNAAYVYPEFAFAHELLSLAAALGHLIQGRSIWLSPAMAASLIEVIAGASKHEPSAVAIQTVAEEAGGSRRLRAAAGDIVADGVARQISPRRPGPEKSNAETESHPAGSHA
jgi:hypothetical protein